MLYVFVMFVIWPAVPCGPCGAVPCGPCCAFPCGPCGAIRCGAVPCGPVQPLRCGPVRSRRPRPSVAVRAVRSRVARAYGPLCGLCVAVPSGP